MRYAGKLSLPQALIVVPYRQFVCVMPASSACRQAVIVVPYRQSVCVMPASSAYPQALIVAYYRCFVCDLDANLVCVSRETFQFFSLNPLSFTVVVI